MPHSSFDPQLAELRRRLPSASAKPGRHARRSVGRWGLARGWVLDRLPPWLQGRVQLGGTHLTVVAVGIALGLAVTAWWVIRGQAVQAVDVSPPVLASPVAAHPAAEVSPDVGRVVVDVAGRVRKPGIATLPAGSRVVDALRAAGGVRPGVDLSGINRARLLADGEQLLVGVDPPAGTAAGVLSSPSATSPGGALVNLNTADQATLESLPDVGPVTAAAIVEWREENGGFHAVDELLDVSGIGDATLAKLAPLVTV